VTKRFLELTHLERGAHQDRHLVERVALALELLDFLADRARLFLRIPCAGDADLLARLVLGAQRLAEPAFIVRDEVRGGTEDMAGRAVLRSRRTTVAPGKSFSKRRMLSTSAPRQP